MTEKESALYSQYIIDGIRCDATPAELLSECMTDEDFGQPDPAGFEDILDESTDPPVTSFRYCQTNETTYLEDCLKEAGKERAFRLLYPEAFTRQRIGKALIDRIWNEGHFRLGNLNLWAKWIWNTRPLGNMAAFYHSVESASGYIFDLGVKLEDYVFNETDLESHLQFYAWLPEKDSDENDENQEEIQVKDSPFQSSHPWISEQRKCPSKMNADPSDWLIYIPFDTCQHKIGGSLLAQTQGHNGGVGPHIQDPDYFIDCYEVVRELVEDGIVTAGATVSDGGLATAVGSMCGSCGTCIDLCGLMSSYQETDTTKLLFSEIPGVVIQISDYDYDYLDSQLLLQDIAYYPIGHPDPSVTDVTFKEGSRCGVAGILASLLEQASEGED
jgi:phosphoribosylformylglycinamidine synthase